MRKQLSEVNGPGHPALWLGSWVGELKSDDAKKSAVANAARWEPDATYSAAFERWHGALGDIGARREELVTDPALIVGLSGGSPIETSVTLLHPYGVPVIPGSALKGLASAYARQALGESVTKDHRDVLFGKQADAGFVTFVDAWWVPGSSTYPLSRDVMTPHHTGYYGSQGAKPPTDFDDPTPIPFVHARGKFLVGVVCDDREWREFAFKLLCTDLADWGVGAKTAAGYGRLVRDPVVVAAEKRMNEVDKTLTDMVERMGDPKGKAEGTYRQIMQHPSPTSRAAALELLHPPLRKAGMLKDKWIDQKPGRAWIREFLEACKEHGVGE